MSYENEVIDFSKIETPTEASFLEPGMYRLKVDPAKVTVEAPANKTPYLSVRFVSETGASLTEKFYLTAKALGRFQYLHEVWFNKKLDRSFTSMLEVGEYFKKGLTAKIVTRPMVTGGKVANDGRFYSGLPYLGFVVTDESKFEEGAFDKDSEQYKRVVSYDKPNASTGTDSTMLPSAEDLKDAGTPWS